MTVFDKTYDVVVSLGQWCAVAMAMKKCGLRSASGPFDWMGGGCPIGSYVDMLTTNFAGFFLKENMKKLGDVPGEGTEHWKDTKLGWEIRHEFRGDVPFDVNYANFHALVARRGERLFKTLRSGGRLLFIHWLAEGRYRREEVIAAIRRLREAFPETQIDLLVIETELFAKGVALEEIERGVVVAVGDFYDPKRYDAVVGNEKLAVSVMKRIHMRGRWRNRLGTWMASFSRRLRGARVRRAGLALGAAIAAMVCAPAAAELPREHVFSMSFKVTALNGELRDAAVRRATADWLRTPQYRQAQQVFAAQAKLAADSERVRALARPVARRYRLVRCAPRSGSFLK